MADDLRLFGITGDWSTAALDPMVWYSTVVDEGGCRFMAAWVKAEENASKHRQRKREAEEADKVVVAATWSWGDCSKLEMLSSRVDWTNPMTP